METAITPLDARPNKRLADSIEGLSVPQDEEAPRLVSTLQPHQQDFVSMMRDSPGLVAVHGLGSGKCTRGDTVILMENGVHRIDTLFSPDEIPNCGDMVLSGGDTRVWSPTTNDWVGLRARYVQRLPESEHTVQISGAYGTKMDVTMAHPILVLRGGEMVWVPAANIVVGDFLCVQSQVGSGCVVKSTDLIDLITWQVTESWENPTTSTVTITQKDTAILEHLLGVLRRLVPGIQTGYIREGKKKRSPYLEISSLEYKGRLIGEDHVWGVLSRSRELPWWFVRLEDELLARGLRNIFEAEGSCGDKGVEFCSASRKLALQVQYSLRRFGIVSTFERMMKMATNGKRIPREYFRIVISGDDIESFGRFVGFLSERKNKNLVKLRAKSRNTNHGIPVGWLHCALGRIGIGHRHMGCTKNNGRTISACTARKVVANLWDLVTPARREKYRNDVTRLNGISCTHSVRTLEALESGRHVIVDATERMDRLINGGFRFIEVESVNAGEAGGLVYDVEVDSDDYNCKCYVGGIGGVSMHNTISSIATAVDENRPIEAIVPAALRGNYRKEIAKHVAGPVQSRIRSYDEAARDGGVAPDSVLILDEAHRIRNAGTARSDAIMAMSPLAAKRIALTGTPVYNKPADLAQLINFAAGRNVLPSDPRDFNRDFIMDKEVNPGLLGKLIGADAATTRRLKNAYILKDAFRRYVHYHPSASAGFPERQDHVVNLEMTPEQTATYRGVMSGAPWWLRYKVRKHLPASMKETRDLNAFLSGTRQVANTSASHNTTADPAASPKFNAVSDSIAAALKDNPNHRAVVFSPYLRNGVGPVAEMLAKRGIGNSVFSGSLNDTERQAAVSDYNEGRKPVLLVSGAGAEGLDLKGTRSIHILNQHFNRPLIDQVIGRGIRYGSHAALPEDQRKVDVYEYLARPRAGLLKRMTGTPNEPGVDEWLRNMAMEKQGIADQVRHLMEETQQEREDKMQKSTSEGKKVAIWPFGKKEPDPEIYYQDTDEDFYCRPFDPKKDTVQSRVAELVREHAYSPPGGISPRSKFDDLRMDELDRVYASMDAEDIFSVNLVRYREPRSVGELSRQIQRAMKIRPEPMATSSKAAGDRPSLDEIFFGTGDGE